ncbi:MAG: hypothetical protein IPK00_12345 [Deltaproteobacteria bacterium]|nr:hypothetical protein [Deltaproteobacteria bacterium]
MTTDDASRTDPAIGLCGSCLHLREQASRRGSVFYRCARADEDERYPRYPALPVLRCRGHEPRGAGINGSA